MVLLTRAVVLAVHTMALEILFYCVCALGYPNASSQYLALATEQQKGSLCPSVPGGRQNTAQRALRGPR